MFYQSVQFKYGYFCSTKELKTFNPDVTTGELRRSNAPGNVAVLRRDRTGVGSLRRKRRVSQERREVRDSTEAFTSL